jgi:hypothetical protein
MPAIHVGMAWSLPGWLADKGALAAHEEEGRVGCANLHLSDEADAQRYRGH